MYTLHQIVEDLITFGIPEDYFDPSVVITFGNKQYVADFRNLAMLDLFRYPYEETDDKTSTVTAPVLNFYNPDLYLSIPVKHAGNEIILKIKLKQARIVYKQYCKKCLDYINTYNMLVEGIIDIFKNSNTTNMDRDKAIDDLYATSKVGSNVNRIKKL